MQSRSRTVTSAAINGGGCVALSESQPCTSECVSCVVSQWSASVCYSACGVSAQIRTVTRPATCTPSVCAPCPSDLTRDVNCSSSGSCGTPSCPVSYGAWSACDCQSSTLNGGESVGNRTRTVYSCSSNSSTEIGSCFCPIDCKLSPFGDYSSCSPACGEGSRARARVRCRSAAR